MIAGRPTRETQERCRIRSGDRRDLGRDQHCQQGGSVADAFGNGEERLRQWMLLRQGVQAITHPEQPLNFVEIAIEGIEP